MVYMSGNKFAKSTALMNQNQGGGPKKPGLGRGIGPTQFVLTAYRRTTNNTASNALIFPSASTAQQAWRRIRY